MSAPYPIRVCILVCKDSRFLQLRNILNTKKVQVAAIVMLSNPIINLVPQQARNANSLSLSPAPSGVPAVRSGGASITESAACAECSTAQPATRFGVGEFSAPWERAFPVTLFLGSTVLGQAYCTGQHSNHALERPYNPNENNYIPVEYSTYQSCQISLYRYIYIVLSVSCVLCVSALLTPLYSCSWRSSETLF